jgi:catechol 2,3-dioxygenase-like lactoylglutathione lyase family enzyme
MILGFHHVAVSTPDMARFIDWYERMFGFVRAGSGGWEVGNARIDRMTGHKDSSARYAMIRRGNLYIEVFEYASPEGEGIRPRPCDHGITHFCFYTDDVYADYDRLVAQGMHFNCPPGDSGPLRATYGRDCDGNLVELLQIMDEDCAFPYLG